MIPVGAVEAAMRAFDPSWDTVPTEWRDYFLRRTRAALEAAAPYMVAGIASDEVLAILEAAGVDKVNQFDALVAVQKLAESRK